MRTEQSRFRLLWGELRGRAARTNRFAVYSAGIIIGRGAARVNFFLRFPENCDINRFTCEEGKKSGSRPGRERPSPAESGRGKRPVRFVPERPWRQGRDGPTLPGPRAPAVCGNCGWYRGRLAFRPSDLGGKAFFMHKYPRANPGNPNYQFSIIHCNRQRSCKL